MKQATKDVEQALSVPCRRLEFGPSDVARAFLRAVSPFVATCPAIKRPGNPTSRQPSRAPNLPQHVLLSGSTTAKVCQKTRESDAFLPTSNPSVSKKVMENKDTIG